MGPPSPPRTDIKVFRGRLTAGLDLLSSAEAATFKLHGPFSVGSIFNVGLI